MELVTLPASVVFAGPDTRELVVAFRVSDRMSDVAVEVDEAPDGVTVRVEAKLDAPSEASCGWFPFLTHTSAAFRSPRGSGCARSGRGARRASAEHRGSSQSQGAANGNVRSASCCLRVAVATAKWLP